jgi:hypothetical protein
LSKAAERRSGEKGPFMDATYLDNALKVPFDLVKALADEDRAAMGTMGRIVEAIQLSQERLHLLI